MKDIVGYKIIALWDDGTQEELPDTGTRNGANDMKDDVLGVQPLSVYFEAMERDEAENFWDEEPFKSKKELYDKIGVPFTGAN